jgi:predicted ATPase/DNA-binding SARP family transcriptional activator
MSLEQPASSLPLEIRLFGPFDVRISGEPLPRLRSRKGAWLLALLVMRHDREVSRDWLAGTLWPESEESQARLYLRQSLTNLRTALGGEAYRLRSPSLHTLRFDVGESEADVLAFDAALARGDRASLERAVSLYCGPLLEDCLEEWVLQEREARTQACLSALETLAQRCLTEHDHSQAQYYLRRVVSADPLRETARRSLMHALAQSGDFAAATQAYRDLRLYLHRELHAEPDPETRSLFERLRSEARRSADLRTPRSAERTSLPVSSPPFHRIPYPITALIGREKEVHETGTCLQQGRLVTLTGPGGVGKTRLAIATAHAFAEEFAARAVFVDLSPLSDGGLVPQAVAAALDIREEPGRPLLHTLLDRLQSQALLLVMDNCEHLIEACAQLIGTALPACAWLRVLATSRQPLGLTGEQILRVPSLSLPTSLELPSGKSDLTPLLMEYEAIRLFVDRALLARSTFCLNRENAPFVAQICLRLDGIPLALELAAARLRGLPVEQIAQRLDDRFHLLKGKDRTALPRHQTLQAAIDWSYDLLTEPERALLLRLSAFAGGSTLEEAQAVCAGEGVAEEAVLDLLCDLVDQSLVYVEESAGAARYRLLETTRQYAWERLTAEGEAPRWRHRHADYFLQLAEKAEDALQGPEQTKWLDRLQATYDNLRAALDWLTDASSRDSEERGLRLAGALIGFWAIRGPVNEGPRWLEKALAGGTARTAARAAALVGLSRLRPGWAGPERRRSLLEEGLAIYEEIGNPLGIAETLRYLSSALEAQGDYGGARTLMERSLTLYRQSGNDHGVARVLNLIGKITFTLGDYAEARDLLERSLTIAQETDNKLDTLGPLNNLGLVAYVQGDYRAARRFHEACLAINRELESKAGIAWSLCNLGETTFTAGDPVEARDFYTQSLALFVQLEHQLGIPECVRGLALVAGAQYDSMTHVRRAVRLFGAAQALRETLGAPIPPCNRAEYEQSVEVVRATLGEDAFAAMWAEGRTMTMGQAIDYALNDAQESITPQV